jgi:hypothetical protein
MWYALPTGGNPDKTHIAQDGAALQPEQTCSGKPVSSGLKAWSPSGAIVLTAQSTERGRVYRIKDSKASSADRVKQAA